MIYTPKNKLLSLGTRAAEVCLFMFDRLVFGVLSLLPRQRRSGVLLVRLDAIGDFVLWLATAKEIRCMYPNDKITLLGNELWTDLAKKLAWFDIVIPLNRKRFFMNPWYRAATLGKLHRRGFRSVLHAVYSRDFLAGDACVRATGAQERIGFVGNAENSRPWQKKIGDGWYTKLIPSPPRHQLEQDADFLQALGSAYTLTLPSLPRFPLPPDFTLRDYYVLVPGAGHEMRQWSVRNFQELARRIHSRTGLTCVVCGGSREHATGLLFMNNLGIPARNMIGRTPLPDLAAIIGHARFVVGNDTGAIHIAAALATPSVCILGGAHPGRYIPYPVHLGAPLYAVYHPMNCYNCDWHCVHEEGGVVPCISEVTVDEVWHVVQEDIVSNLRQA
jgi:ADP-heptose:LPS heptosyltransferase